MKLSRRAFDALILSGAAATALSLGLAAPALAQDAGQSHLGIPVEKIGLVGFTVRSQIGEDPRGTLQAVTECGIENIEFSGPNFDGPVPSFQGVEVPAIQEFAEEFGFNVPSLGVNAEHLTDQLDQVIEAAQTVGATYVRISGGPDEGEDATAYYTDLAAMLNEAGAGLSEAGITVAYHNHGHEFEDLGNGQSGYDILLSETDPELVSFELDLYWAIIGAADAVELIEANPGRFPLLHVKDAQNVTNAEGAEEITFATVGKGFINFQEVFDLSDVAGVDYYFIENDRPEPDGVTSACEGYAYLTAETDPN
ncbi:sugar phosphate isomerase/epimerase family protein [Pelagibacterium mangrovi]|uniref:sugar phosphate isomerase/epimerase family protein n=1 Tax=Pelagibacterium mangrovi TaxID=3119828 RepID=UPI002FC72154